MSKNVCACSFNTFDIHSMIALSYFEPLLTPSTYIAFNGVVKNPKSQFF